MTLQHQDTNLVSPNQQYEYLLQELNAIATETSYEIREIYARAKYAVGETICTSPLYVSNKKKLLERISDDMEVTLRELYYCVQFYDIVAELASGNLDAYIADLPFGKTLSWTKVKKHLPTHHMPLEQLKVREKKEKLKLRAPRIKKSIYYSQEKIGKVWTQADHQFMMDHLKVKL